MRVVIATVTAGGGHLAAAAALEEAWRKCRPQDELKKVDVLDFASKLYRRIYIDSYVKIIEHAPEIYGMLFKATDDADQAQDANNFRRTFAHRTNRGFVKFLKEFQPDVVICTHYLPLEILSHVKQNGEGPFPLTICTVTDFEAHAFWLESCVDLYCVAEEATKASLVARGAKPEDVVVTGIPVAGKFAEEINQLAVRRRFGLRDDLPTLLVLSGGFGMGPVEELIDQLDAMETEFQAVVVAGRNEELRCSIAVKDRKHPIDVMGFADNMHELMSVSDIIISKPGGLTTSEALALGKPMFIVNPIPGQETANSDFLLERGAATKVNRAEDLPFKLQQLLTTGKLTEMAEAARALGKPNAAIDICNAVSARVSNPSPPPPAAFVEKRREETTTIARGAVR